MIHALNIPGYQNSGENHWQTHWEHDFNWLKRVQMPDWETPLKEEWVDTLNKAILDSGSDVYLVAHSLGCTTTSLISESAKARVKGAFLVSNPDLENNDSLPECLYSFTPIPHSILSFPTLMVASTNDPYCPIGAAKNFAADWGSKLEIIGDKGHISGADVGEWDEGKKLLLNFIEHTEAK